ncbi:rCG63186 [Rattus norvegicus]|uniref:RCG63186 n=1 Tax=Rattus norvegicus TaxID=10116 RepID=A6JZ13_RAT|nr:rCG63186 [Rattus norvegicus]
MGSRAPSSSFSPFSDSFNGDPVLSSVVCCWHSPMYLPYTVCVSQERSTSRRTHILSRIFTVTHANLQ